MMAHILRFLWRLATPILQMCLLPFLLVIYPFLLLVIFLIDAWEGTK